MVSPLKKKMAIGRRDKKKKKIEKKSRSRLSAPARRQKKDLKRLLQRLHSIRGSYCHHTSSSIALQKDWRSIETEKLFNFFKKIWNVFHWSFDLFKRNRRIWGSKWSYTSPLCINEESTKNSLLEKGRVIHWTGPALEKKMKRWNGARKISSTFRNDVTHVRGTEREGRWQDKKRKRKSSLFKKKIPTAATRVQSLCVYKSETELLCSSDGVVSWHNLPAFSLFTIFFFYLLS